ncbi:MAG TPA: sugar ABC transporter permease, partial [Bacillota bacterium]|nr:sugar ABC transporter permease [Bacillota bacterium]
LEGYTTDFLGLDSYKYALTIHPTFVKEVVNSLTTMLYQLPVIIFFSLFIAVILNQKMQGRAFFRAMFFLPVILSTGIVAKAELMNLLMQNMEGMAGIETGAAAASGGFDVDNVRVLLQSIYISPGIVDYVLDLVNNIYNVVHLSGVQIILFMAGLQGISPTIYESAQIEGASGWETFWKITVPMISPIIFVNLIYSVVDMLTRSDNPIMLLISDVAFNNMNYSASAAMSWLYFGALVLVLGLVAFACYRFIFYQD